jgi:hypothetical protein
MKSFFRVLPTSLLLLLMASCHPEGCYGPKAFGYNTKGVAASNLFGVYTFDGASGPILDRIGFTNHSGSIELKPDMTFMFSKIPCIAQKGVYSSTSGKWRIVPNNAIWEIEFYDGAGFNSIGGYSSLSLPILGGSPPYGIELAINHNEGYYVRLQGSQKAK